VNSGLLGEGKILENEMNSQVLTVAEIAKDLEQTPGRINYVISRERIRASARVGNIRLVNEVAVERIRLAFARSQRAIVDGFSEPHPNIIA